MISLSSVTNLEAFDKPVVDYHRGSFLKEIRRKLLPKLKEELPDVANQIRYQGKRVQTNAYIKFTEKDWGHWVRLHSHPHEGKVRLMIISDRWICKAKRDTLHACIDEAGIAEEFKALDQQFLAIGEKYNDYSNESFMKDVVRRDDCFVIDLYVYVSMPSIEAFYDKEVIATMGKVVADIYRLSVGLQSAKEKLQSKFGL